MLSFNIIKKLLIIILVFYLSLNIAHIQTISIGNQDMFDKVFSLHFGRSIRQTGRIFENDGNPTCMPVKKCWDELRIFKV